MNEVVGTEKPRRSAGSRAILHGGAILAGFRRRCVHETCQ
ncbi:hypothetical protein MA5S0921_2591 [Mycobacteroides abscessus 5S-0921]|uniref:Uncharacterized protein n=1 Tax=Mycobacteroides abscessus subsp. bolletii 1513 TaxID=1299321 RepID=X8DSA5_9MYCO|nr:hypothetical protein MA5S0921_2591 [Mycobacteroides abscessus 5S-0921]EUA70375.1 hypothetical protein I540_3023 [Mycobacteroides abscessus subsp. bolletii 1513]